MISKISLLTAIIFAVTYPLCFWISFKEPLKQNFHRFHIGLPCFVAGIVAVMVLISNYADIVIGMVFSWAAMLLIITYANWKKETPNPFMVTVPCVWGMVLFVFSYEEILGRGIEPIAIPIGILSGLIFSSALYAMNLGHWYLNVHGLPIKHLRWAVNVFGVFLMLRLLVDIFGLFAFKKFYDGIMIPLWKFTLTTDGIFLWLAIFFGVLFPLVSLYFVYGTLKVRNTQSATGILYVILSAVLVGDLTYKYYLVKFGIAL